MEKSDFSTEVPILKCIYEGKTVSTYLLVDALGPENYGTVFTLGNHNSYDVTLYGESPGPFMIEYMFHENSRSMWVKASKDSHNIRANNIRVGQYLFQRVTEGTFLSFGSENDQFEFCWVRPSYLKRWQRRRGLSNSPNEEEPELNASNMACLQESTTQTSFDVEQHACQTTNETRAETKGVLDQRSCHPTNESTLGPKVISCMEDFIYHSKDDHTAATIYVESDTAVRSLLQESFEIFPNEGVLPLDSSSSPSTGFLEEFSTKVDRSTTDVESENVLGLPPWNDHATQIRTKLSRDLFLLQHDSMSYAPSQEPFSFHLLSSCGTTMEPEYGSINFDAHTKGELITPQHQSETNQVDVSDEFEEGAANPPEFGTLDTKGQSYSFLLICSLQIQLRIFEDKRSASLVRVPLPSEAYNYQIGLLLYLIQLFAANTTWTARSKQIDRFNCDNFYLLLPLIDTFQHAANNKECLRLLTLAANAKDVLQLVHPYQDPFLITFVDERYSKLSLITAIKLQSGKIQVTWLANLWLLKEVLRSFVCAATNLLHQVIEEHGALVLKDEEYKFYHFNGY